MMIQNGIGEGELTRGCFITTYMFKIDDVGTALCSMSFFGQIVSMEQFGDAAAALSMANATRCGLAGFGLFHRSEPSARSPDKDATSPVYRRSISTLRSINDTEEQRAFDLPQPFCGTSDYALKGGSPLSTLENNAFGNVADPQLIKAQQ